MPFTPPSDGRWDGTEFFLDPAGLQGVAGEVGRVYDDVNTALTDWADAVDLSAEELGDPDLASDYSKFMQAWSQETNLGESALGDLVKKVSTANQLFQETDDGLSATEFDRLHNT
jgi:uncharacterized protein YukE